MNLEKWVKSIETAGYNGAHTVASFDKNIFKGQNNLQAKVLQLI